MLKKLPIIYALLFVAGIFVSGCGKNNNKVQSLDIGSESACAGVVEGNLDAYRYQYKISGDCVYYNGILIESADPGTLIDISSFGYAKDNKKVYFNGQVVEGADSASIRCDQNYCIDKNNVYLHGRILTDADAATFITLDASHAKDKNSVFINGKKMLNSDPATYILLTSGYTKDKNNVYFQESVVVGADSQTFKVDGFQSGSDGNDEFFRDYLKSKATSTDSWLSYKYSGWNMVFKYPEIEWRINYDYPAVKMFRKAGPNDEDDPMIIILCQAGYAPEYSQSELCDGNEKKEKIKIGQEYFYKIKCKDDLLVGNKRITIRFSGYKEEQQFIDSVITTIKFE